MSGSSYGQSLVQPGQRADAGDHRPRDHGALRALCRSTTAEAREVARVLGVELPASLIERRLDAAAAMAGHRMSMLQDLERGPNPGDRGARRAVQEASRMTGAPRSALDAVLALVRERSLHEK
jgi:2-dehydropantoate 2-reductase